MANKSEVKKLKQEIKDTKALKKALKKAKKMK